MNSLLGLGLLSVLFLRPFAMGILLLPLLLWILTRIQPRPELRFTGAFKFWRDQQALESSSIKRRRAPLRPVIFLVLLALTFGALGLLGLAGHNDAPVSTWRVLVDNSPSMHLPASGAEAERRSRLVLGVDQAQRMLKELAGPLDSIEWLFANVNPELLDIDIPPNMDWLDGFNAPGASASTPDNATAGNDAAGTIWVTDRAPSVLPSRAGLIAVGGEAVPGCIAFDGELRVDWTGHMLVESVHQASKRRVRIDVRGQAQGAHEEDRNPLQELFLLWARQRQYELASADDPAPDLVLSFAPKLETDVGCRASSGRWSLSGKGAALLLGSGLGAKQESPWLQGWAGGQPGALMATTRPGQIRLAWSELESPRGSQAAFALEWSEMFDRCLATAPGVISLAERKDAGAAQQILPERPSSGGGETGEQEPWSAWLAAAAAALGLTALAWDHARG